MNRTRRELAGGVEIIATLVWAGGLYLTISGRGRRRRGARAEIGDESRRLRDGLVGRMRSPRRKRPVTRPEPQRSPS